MSVGGVFHHRRRGVALAVAMLVGACEILPSHGPAGRDISKSALSSVVAPDDRPSAQPYAFVELNGEMARFLATRTPPGLAGAFTDRSGPVGLVVGPGDVLSVTIFEAAPGGLFTPGVSSGARPGNFVELPAQVIGREGVLSVPFAGNVPAAGRTPNQIEREIETRLRNRAIEPQAVITVREQRSKQVSVLGEVNAAARLSLSPQGERILDVIARAGGPKFPNYETLVTLQRGGRRASVGMSRLVRDPANNIFAQPGDAIVLSREQRSFSALGAQGQNGQFFLDTEAVTVAQGMGKAGGLLDERANPGAVFIYRQENRRTLERLGVDVSQFSGPDIATIYGINLRDPSGFFIAQSLPLQDRDVMFVANAISVDISKFLNFVRLFIATGREAQALREPHVGTDD